MFYFVLSKFEYSIDDNETLHSQTSKILELHAQEDALCTNVVF